MLPLSLRGCRMSAFEYLIPTVSAFWKQLETNSTKHVASGFLLLVSKPVLWGSVTHNSPPPPLYSRTVILRGKLHALITTRALRTRLPRHPLIYLFIEWYQKLNSRPIACQHVWATPWACLCAALVVGLRVWSPKTAGLLFSAPVVCSASCSYLHVTDMGQWEVSESDVTGPSPFLAVNNFAGVGVEASS